MPLVFTHKLRHSTASMMFTFHLEVGNPMHAMAWIYWLTVRSLADHNQTKKSSIEAIQYPFLTFQWKWQHTSSSKFSCICVNDELPRREYPTTCTLQWAFSEIRMRRLPPATIGKSASFQWVSSASKRYRKIQRLTSSSRYISRERSSLVFLPWLQQAL